jgi:hypothetical protein
MPDDVAGHLDRLYQHSEHQADTDLVFADPMTSEPLGHRRPYERLRAALKAAALDETYGFHWLRHSYGTARAARGIPMRTLQEWMGHRDIQTTQRYADYCPNPGERSVVEAAFARGTKPGNRYLQNHIGGFDSPAWQVAGDEYIRPWSSPWNDSRTTCPISTMATSDWSRSPRP